MGKVRRLVMKLMAAMVVMAMADVMGGCVGLSGGQISGRRTGFDVGGKLTAGMSVEEVMATLRQGGNAMDAPMRVRDVQGRFVVEEGESSDGKLLGEYLARMDASESARVTQGMMVSRGWGFFGFDVFYLYFDEKRLLVRHFMQHYN